MLKPKKILGIIPARSGSKGIPDKNVLEIKGKPLIAYTILPALEALNAGCLSRLIVSTDSDRYAHVARSWGAEVPFLRPPELAQDKSPSLGYVNHALDILAETNELYDAVLILQPTSPLRTADDIKKGVELFCHRSQPSLISGYAEDYVNDSVMYTVDDQVAAPLRLDHNSGSGRQTHGTVYVRNGALYICDTDFIRREQKVIAPRPTFYLMPKWRSVNIDSIEDLELFKRLL